MSETSKPEVGAIGWADLTVENAEQVRDFYRDVVGWKVTELSMGDYSGYCMNATAGGKTVAGVCHARGTNADLPPQWPHSTNPNPSRAPAPPIPAKDAGSSGAGAPVRG